MADGRSRAGPGDVPPLSAAALVQARVLSVSPTPAAGFRKVPREQLAERCPGRPPPAAALHATRSALGPNARNPVRPEVGWAWMPAGLHWRLAEVPRLPAPTAGELLAGAPARSAVLPGVSARPPAGG